MSKHEKDPVNRKSIASADKWPLKIDRLDEARKQKILELLEKAVEKNHTAGMNCSERTFACIYDAFEKSAGFPREIIRLATGLAGGGGSTSYGLCGAVSGGLMGLGIFWGRADPMDFLRTMGLNSIEEAKENPIESSQYQRIFSAFMKEFEDSFGSVICGELIKDYLDSNGVLGSNPTIEEERKDFCKRFTTWAPSRVVQLILEAQEKGIRDMKMAHNIHNIQ
jgi:C_GCAxxG_C_C family probable redox protein